MEMACCSELARMGRERAVPSAGRRGAGPTLPFYIYIYRQERHIASERRKVGGAREELYI